jgi:hypothetical protein
LGCQSDTWTTASQFVTKTEAPQHPSFRDIRGVQAVELVQVEQSVGDVAEAVVRQVTASVINEEENHIISPS